MRTAVEEIIQQHCDVAKWVELGDGLVSPAVYASWQEECEAIRSRAALVDRATRCLIAVSGEDRASWLQNLTTNHVASLQSGEGQYAFCLNVKGRILFDIDVLARPQSLWLALDRRYLTAAREHFEKYIITEDVVLEDRGDEFACVGLTGPQSAAVLASLGVAHASNLPQLSAAAVRLASHTIPLIRHDFCGQVGFELFVPVAALAEAWGELAKVTEPVNLVPAGYEAVETHRVEAGIPKLGAEITDEVLPAETRQLDRAVNYQKGCYLGQEVVERMRSRGGLARQLASLQIEGEAPPQLPAAIETPEGNRVGTLTSVARSIAREGLLGLGLLKVAQSRPDTALRVCWEGQEAAATVVGPPPVAH